MVITYHQGRERAQEVARECDVLQMCACDFRNWAEITRSVQESRDVLGSIDAVIQAVGISGDPAFYRAKSNETFNRLLAADADDFDQVISVNTRGSFAAAQASFSVMRESGGGNIVLIGSMDGVKAVPSPPHFAASKAALRGIVESVAKEIGADDVRINLIAPGIIEGGASTDLGEELKARYLKHCGLKRFGTPEEVAEVAVWFALRNTYVTGQCILLDGGL